MSRIILIGAEGKRRDFFLKAASELGKSVEIIDICDISKSHIRDFDIKASDVIKIDPPSYIGENVSALSSYMADYKKLLYTLADYKDVSFLNHPIDIYNCLDKIYIKDRLKTHSIPASPKLDIKALSFSDLVEELRSLRISQVFIKLNFSSGAAGIAALRANFKNDEFVLYTTLVKSALESDVYYNSKRVERIFDRDKMSDIVDYLLMSGSIVERWIAKDSVDSKTYDLRCLYQFGHIRYIQARASKYAAITNLHLNNAAISLDSLNLTKNDIEVIEKLCLEAAAHFPGLNVIGFDILLEKNTKKPYIIELNAQGDLIYSDIYEDNSIYKEQIRKMCDLCQG